jgi:hypothetical protein
MYAANPALSYSRISEWAALHIRRRFIQPMNVQRAAFSQNLTKSEAALPCPVSEGGSYLSAKFSPALLPWLRVSPIPAMGLRLRDVMLQRLEKWSRMLPHGVYRIAAMALPDRSRLPRARARRCLFSLARAYEQP